MNESLTACGVQFDCKLGETVRNAEFIAGEVGAAVDANSARLVVFPEAALTGYVFETEAEALDGSVEADGPETKLVARACRAAGAWAVVGAVERDAGRVFNSAFLIGPEGLVGRYRKVHTLCLGVDRFAERGEAFRVWDLPIGRIGLNICYDGTFPESSRTLKLLGAQLIVLPTNWPRLDMKRAQTTMRAYENHVNYLAVNRVGEERGTVFPGGSMAVDPLGRIIAEGGDGPERIVAEFDMKGADANRVVLSPGAYEFDYRADRRPGAYRPIVDQTPPGTPTGSAAGSAEAAGPAT
ncbi:MAG TPA: carbon-nitrogen hydrolase family protein [Gemmatimonadota bacterium]|nr:carbon-nitrogen hydrolase family protein [Gemmatimonadota bacterium]